MRIRCVNVCPFYREVAVVNGAPTVSGVGIHVSLYGL
jgi:hypothetical protein